MAGIFKGMSVRGKIGSGFAVLLLITVLLGIVAIWHMHDAEVVATNLIEQYIPEIEISARTERDALLTMYDIRGYAFSGDKDFLSAGRKNLARLKEDITRAGELAEKYEALTMLREELGRIRQKLADYERFVSETDESDFLDKDRMVLNNAAKSFVEHCEELRKIQIEALLKEVSANKDVRSVQRHVPGMALAGEIFQMGNAVQVLNFKAQATRDMRLFDDAMATFDGMEKKLAELLSLDTSQGYVKKLEEVRKAVADYKRGMLSSKEGFQTLRKVRVERERLADQILESARSVSTTGLKRVMDAGRASIAELSNTMGIIIIGLCFALTLGVFLSIAVTRTLTRPVTKLVETTRRFGEGDLRAQLDVDTGDEIGILAESFKEMARSMREIIKKLFDGTARLSSSSAEIAAALEEMSRGADMQASQILKTSSGMEEMSVSIREVSRSAQSTSSSAVAASEAAKEGFVKVKKTVEGINRANDTIKRLNQRTQQIGKVVQLIGEVAVQTNILALNAAIEAARAGEHGRGFDVVAEEIRKLALRTSQATGEISSSIEEIVIEAGETVKIMEASTNMANETGQTLQDIVDGITSTSDMTQMISSAAVQQAKTAEDIADALQAISGVSRQTVQASQESARATQDLSVLAEQLKEITERFRI